MSGGYWIEGRNWGPLNGTLAVASLKNSTLRFFEFDDDGNFVATELADELNGTLLDTVPGPPKTIEVRASDLRPADWLPGHQDRLPPAGDPVSEAVSALVSLGLKPQEASQRVRAVPSEGLVCEEIVRLALQSLVK